MLSLYVSYDDALRHVTIALRYEPRTRTFVAVTRCRLDDETKAFMERKLSEGKTKKEAIRCLKRHLANVVYRNLVADGQQLKEAA